MLKPGIYIAENNDNFLDSYRVAMLSMKLIQMNMVEICCKETG